MPPTSEDFLVPSLLREVRRSWLDPSLEDGHVQLLGELGLAGDRDPDERLGEWLIEILDVLEPTLVLLCLCGYETTRVVIASGGTDLAVSVPLDPASGVTSVPRVDWPPPLQTALLDAPAAVGLELSTRSTLPVPLTAPSDGWLFVAVASASSTLDLATVLGNLPDALGEVTQRLVLDAAAVVGTSSLTDVVADATRASGYLGALDPTAWAFPPAAAGGDEEEADAITALGEQIRTRISATGIAEFLHQEAERGRASRVALRDRFRDDREHRQVLRRGMRGARRRHRAQERDTLRRAFRLGRSRRWTYTEFLLACHVEEVVDILYAARLRDLALDEGDRPGGEPPAPGEPPPAPDEPEPGPATPVPAGGEDLGSVRLRVVDDTGAALPRAAVEVFDDQDVATFFETDRDGTLLIGDQVPGDYEATVGFPQCAAQTVGYAIRPGATEEVAVVLPRILGRISVECLKYVSESLQTAWTRIHSCYLYAFTDDAALTPVPPGAPLAVDHAGDAVFEPGDPDRPYGLVVGQTYRLYFAGRELADPEITQLRTTRSHIPLRVTISGEVVRIESSFFWWIALLQYVEANLVMADGSPAIPVEVLTGVRKLYYDDGNWNRLIARGDVVPLLARGAARGEAAAETVVRDNLDAVPVMALGRTYALTADGHFAIDADGDRQILDRHDFVTLPDGTDVHLGHVLTGLESHCFGPRLDGALAFTNPRSASTWAGDLGQCVYTAFWELWDVTRDPTRYNALPDPQVAAAWQPAQAAFGKRIEMVGDVHGMALGVLYGREGWLADPSGEPARSLSRLIEDHFLSPTRDQDAVLRFIEAYAAYDVTEEVVRSGQMETILQLQLEVDSFAENWDGRDSHFRPGDPTTPHELYNWRYTTTDATDDRLITLALRYLNDELKRMAGW